MQGIDLHTHSNISDGTLTPALLVEAAIEKGIHTLALTDHDSMDGLIQAEQFAKNQPIQIISGVEISSQWSRPATKKSYGVHIVALNMQNPQPLQRLLTAQKKIRAERAKEICELLIPLVHQDIYADVVAKVDGEPDRITRTHIAKTLVEKGIVQRAQQAFDKYIKEGKKAYVKFDGLGLAETIQVIHESQGFAVLAHPTRYDLSATNIRYLIELFAQHGGDAIELPPAIETASTRQMVDRMIAEHALKVSVGSDFHGDNMPWIKLGNIPHVKEGQIGIWESFR
ncbi:PHP domain-containing protein [Acinetobacter bereziniae]|jgi:predicted metal-dependent phosphoesterase TrpH|uniref:PHP domain-containing protein n=1 Tax=Acinetobacter bereziniae TaxID=106648 RepID=UPI000575C5CD|nr:PHP domain-containing protein [Acinetobacter bereziniae]MBJ8453860.1 PHP domain-containing protein [Acinetobacter bereziniae]MBJ8457959.1 PHP domain-containing protein [Acinetobacter bereziniae]MBJ8551499.1 PHP domain-containing protein [Acinetobacter bereziniae]MDM1786144.1 PHP domain-containing protein [Acinetobacter bereziniae]CEI50648.1 COG0613, Predicted metal-dependent phosphoesterases (PHP family) [Acinetobacter bereziniae]